MLRPSRGRADIADRAQLDTRHWLSLSARQAEHQMAALDEPAAQRAADEAGRTGHQNVRQARPLRRQACLRLAQAISRQMH